MATQTRIAALHWARVEAEQAVPDGHPVVFDARDVLRWSAALRRAQIAPPDTYDGLRPSIDRYVDLGCDPVDMADYVAEQGNNRLNLALRSATAALWVCILHSRPERIRACGRVYSARDCAHVLQLGAEMARDEGLRLWVEGFACQLGWRWNQTHDTDHAGQAVLAELMRQRVSEERAA
jgi:hypothetical protein